jgi:hypothetical protein
MILAAKHIDLHTCTFNVAGVILERLLADHAATIDELMALVERDLGADARFNVVPALTFLYAARVIKYVAASDAVLLEEVAA